VLLALGAASAVWGAAHPARTGRPPSRAGTTTGPTVACTYSPSWPASRATAARYLLRLSFKLHLQIIHLNNLADIFFRFHIALVERIARILLADLINLKLFVMDPDPACSKFRIRIRDKGFETGSTSKPNTTSKANKNNTITCTGKTCEIGTFFFWTTFFHAAIRPSKLLKRGNLLF
jgi:hypothetical protein